MRTWQRLDERGPARDVRRAINRLADIVMRQRVSQGVGYATKETSTGTILRLSGGDGGGASDCEVRRLFVNGVRDTYLECLAISSDSQGTSGSIIPVLRPLALWPTNGDTAPAGTTQESLDAATGQSRTLTVEKDINSATKSFSITQNIVPAYSSGIPVANSKTIYAARCRGLATGVDDVNGDPIQWIDLNIDARHWELDLVETLTCVNDELKYILVPRSGVEEDA